MSLFQVTKKQVIENYELRTMTGDIVSFTPSYSQLLPDPFSDLNVTVNVLATGGYDADTQTAHPINGYTEANITRCDVNLFDKTEVENGYINDSNGNFSPNADYWSSNYIPVKGGQTYYIKTDQTRRAWGAWYDVNKTYISGCTNYNITHEQTAPSNACYLRVTIMSEQDGNIDTFAVNYPSTDTTYHAYNGQTYAIPFGQTVYGGVRDVTRGKLHITHGYVELTDVNFTNFIAVSKMVYGAFPEGTKPAMANDKANIICTHYQTVSRAEVGYSAPYTVTGIGIDPGGNIFVTSPDSSWASVSDAIADFSGVYMAYELATPFDIDLTPVQIRALVGENNVFADCGETTVTCLI